MEVHVQPATRSKMFCGCGIAPLNAPPNTYVCEVCLGLPGVLPAINKAAVEACLKTALALSCEIPRHTKFDRKNYMYPDLPKGYQISQYDLPMSINGSLEVDGRTIRIRRVHLEEDTGKLVHAGDKLHRAWESYVDLNRAGVPLMEIVSEPDLRSADEARDYGMALRTLLRSIGASDADMEKGQMRVEPNISIRSAAIAASIAADRDLADLYEAAIASGAPPLPTANWIVNEVAPSGKLLSGAYLAELMKLVQDGIITRDQARETYLESVETGRTPAQIVAEHGHAQVSDEAELLALAKAVIDANPKAAADYRAGRKQAMQALMADLRKRAPHANPKVASELLLKLLG